MIGPTGVGKTEITRRLASSSVRRSSRSRPRNTLKSVITDATSRAWSATWSKPASRWSRPASGAKSKSRPTPKSKSGSSICSFRRSRVAGRTTRPKPKRPKNGTPYPNQVSDMLRAGELETAQLELSVEAARHSRAGPSRTWGSNRWTSISRTCSRNSCPSKPRTGR